MIQLFNYQQEVFDKTKDKNSFAWFLETGTGKTILSLENIKYLYETKKIKAVIITAPKTVLKPVWLGMLDKYYSDNLDFYVFQWIGSLSDFQNNIIKKLIQEPKSVSKLLIFLINIEAFSHPRIYDLVHKIMILWPTIWIMDESTTIKSLKAQRTKGILKISHLAEYKRILSGYPILKSPEDLYSQIRFLGSNLIPYGSFYTFRNEFCITKQLDNRVTITIGIKNLTKLNETIKPFSIRLLKRQCLDLPPKIKTFRFAEMSTAQITYYKQMKEEGYITLKQTDQSTFASTLLVQLEKLHQIANGIIISLNLKIDCGKYNTLLDIIKNEIGDNQCVIWCSYVMNIIHIGNLLAKHDIEERIMHGDTSIDNRTKILQDFRANKFKVLVANPAVAMFGTDMASASYAIYFSNSFKLEHRLQSEDRLHRIGQVNKVTYIDLITENTIETKILKTLETKHSIGAKVLMDEWEEWFK